MYGNGIVVSYVLSTKDVVGNAVFINENHAITKADSDLGLV